MKNQLDKMAKTSLFPFGRGLQDYEVLNLLGKGAFSNVYRARCRKTGLEVAIKMIEENVLQKWGLFERVSKELSIHSLLKHPNILKFYSCFKDGNYVCLVLELCANGDLSAYLNECKTVSEQEARHIMIQVVDGLIYLHSHNILHRDIKLSNILLTQDMHVKIADFGLATMQVSDERHMTMCGTPNYMPPEVASHRTHGFEFDVWSLGCLLYTLLVGKPPFEMDTVAGTLNRVVAADYTVPDFLSTNAADLINRLLRKNQYDRMQLTEILQHAFFQDCSSIRKTWKCDEFVDSGLDTLTTSCSSHCNAINGHSYDGGMGRSNDRIIYSFDGKRRQQIPDHHFTTANQSEDFKRSRSFDQCSANSNADGFVRDTSSLSERKSAYSYDKMVDYPVLKNSPVNGLVRQWNKELQLTNIDRRYEKCAKNLNPILDAGSSKSADIQKRSSRPLICTASYNRAVDRVNASDPSSLFPSRHTNDYARYRLSPVADNGNAAGACTISSVKSPDLSDRIKITTFSTDRLKAIRQRSKNVVLSILSNGEVCIEFVKTKSKTGQELVYEVCRISSNGKKMSIYYPADGKGVPVGDYPPTLPVEGADAIFNCDALSKDNLKRYTYAARFVEMVQAKTPKITWYNDKAKCVLMENTPEPDFEVVFYSGIKITRSQKGFVLTDNNGFVSMLSDTGQKSVLSRPHAELYDLFDQYYKDCRVIEYRLSSIRSTSAAASGDLLKLFPVIIGRKPLDNDAAADCIFDSPHRTPTKIFHSTEYGIR